MAYIRSVNPEWHTLAIAHGTVEDLRHLLDPEVPIVHVWYHHPVSNTAWMDEWLPLCKGGPRQPLRVRNLQFDFEMPIAAFLADLHRVRRASSGGIHLIHLDRTLPPNVVPWHARGSDDDGRLFDRLLANGMQARFTLPHAGEVGVFAGRSRENLERALQTDDDLRARCIDHDPT